jgi:hypothetical protein
MLAALAAAAAALPSCSDSGGGTDPGDTTPPTVVSKSMTDGAVDVGLITEIAVTFSEDIDPTTLSASSAYVAGRGPLGHIAYDPDERRLSVVPDTLYAQSVWHELVLTDSITDLAGNPLSPDTTSFQTGPLDCAHLADRLEPNDSFAQAAHVEIGETYHTLSACGSDRDIYSFTVTDTVEVSVSTYLKAADPSCGWSIHLLRGEGDYYITIGFGTGQGATCTNAYTFLPGTYYAEIYGGSPSPYVLYDLEITTDEPCRDDAYEDNDFLDEASAISPGLLEGLRGCKVDQDVYSFYADAGQTISVTAAQLPHGLWPHNRITFFDPSQSQIAEADSEEMTHTLSTVASTSGTHYVAVRFWSSVGYTLDLDVSD